MRRFPFYCLSGNNCQMRASVKRRSVYFVYMLRCKDGTLYTGYTNNLEARIKLHNAGRGAKYTRDRRPVKLAWCRQYRYFKNAFKGELEIKKLSKKQKEDLAREGGMEL